MMKHRRTKLKQGVKIEWTVGVQYCRDGTHMLPSDAVEATRAVDNLLVAIFGGASRYELRGSWQQPGGGIVREQGMTFSVCVPFSDKFTEDFIGDQVVIIEQFILGAFNQQSVMQTLTEVWVSF